MESSVYVRIGTFKPAFSCGLLIRGGIVNVNKTGIGDTPRMSVIEGPCLGSDCRLVHAEVGAHSEFIVAESECINYNAGDMKLQSS